MKNLTIIRASFSFAVMTLKFKYIKRDDFYSSERDVYVYLEGIFRKERNKIIKKILSLSFIIIFLRNISAYIYTDI